MNSTSNTPPNMSSNTPLNTVPDDQEFEEQAHLGQGTPSQDPEAVAQFPMKAEETDREATSVLVGGGVVAGAVAGAAIGLVVAGPVGAVVGGTLGTVVGALGAAAAGTMVSPEEAKGAETAPVNPARKYRRQQRWSTIKESVMN